MEAEAITETDEKITNLNCAGRGYCFKHRTMASGRIVGFTSTDACLFLRSEPGRHLNSPARRSTNCRRIEDRNATFRLRNSPPTPEG
jgi:hypothetical protein